LRDVGQIGPGSLSKLGRPPMLIQFNVGPQNSSISDLVG
jgi:hypothetical protein